MRDKQGKIAKDLVQDDFSIDEDGRPQTIGYFAKQTDLPLTLGLLVDTSGGANGVKSPPNAAPVTPSSANTGACSEDKDKSLSHSISTAKWNCSRI